MPIITIQGGMATGKTTLINMIAELNPNVTTITEDIKEVSEKIANNKLDKSNIEDYLIIQKLFIDKEIDRFKQVKNEGNLAFIDSGPEEIEYYTLNYPRTIGKEWDIEDLLKDDLERLRKCRADLVIFLDSSVRTLQVRKNSDNTRRRGFFNYYITEMHAIKREWFLNKDNVVMFDVDKLSKKEVYELVKKTIGQYGYAIR